MSSLDPLVQSESQGAEAPGCSLTKIDALFTLLGFGEQIHLSAGLIEGPQLLA